MAPTRRRTLVTVGSLAGVVGPAGCLDALGSSQLVNEDFESRGGHWRRAGGTRDPDAEFTWAIDRTGEASFRRNFSLRVTTMAPDADGAAWIRRRVPLDHNYSAFSLSVHAWSPARRDDPDRHLVAVFTEKRPEDPAAFPGSPERAATADGDAYGGFRQPLGRRDGWEGYDHAFEWDTDGDRSYAYLAVGVAATGDGDAHHYLDNVRLRGEY